MSNKIRITMKDADGIFTSIRDGIRPIFDREVEVHGMQDLPPHELCSLWDDIQDETYVSLRAYAKGDEYITFEIDLDTGKARLLKVEEY